MTEDKSTTHDVFHVIYHPPHSDSHLLDDLLENVEMILDEDTKILRYAISKEKGTHLHIAYQTVVSYTLPNQRYRWKKLKDQFGWKKFKPCLCVKHHGDLYYLLGYISKELTPIRLCGFDSFDVADGIAKYEGGKADGFIGPSKKNSKLTFDQLGEEVATHCIKHSSVFDNRFMVEQFIDNVLTDLSDKVSISTYHKINSEKFLDWVCKRIMKVKKFDLKKSFNNIIQPQCPEESILLKESVSLEDEKDYLL